MLIYLRINNIALIDCLELEPSAGLNVLTGETGAGKSIIIDALNLVLGGRGSKELVRSGTDKAKVEAIFSMHDEMIPVLEEEGIELQDNLIIYREYNKLGKSICRINGTLVNVSVLNKVGKLLVDMHGQHDNQTLLDQGNHLEIFDRFCGEALLAKKAELNDILNQYNSLVNQMRSIKSNLIENGYKKAELKSIIKEIDDCHIDIEKDKGIEEKRRNMAVNSKSFEALKTLDELLSSEYEENVGIKGLMAKALKILRDSEEFDADFSLYLQRLEECSDVIAEVSGSVSDKLVKLDFDPSIVDEIEERFHLLNDLKQKYGLTLEELVDYRNACAKQYKSLDINKDDIVEMEDEAKRLYGAANKVATEISAIRNEKSIELKKEIEAQLVDLEMKNSIFEVEITESKLNRRGIDKVEFLFSANAGEQVKPLGKIASGGEMSRVMLAIKTVFADVDMMPLLIFDEIDTGISGYAAQRVSEKLKKISSTHQVICVSHHAHIAALADEHFLVNKFERDGSTYSELVPLDKENRIKEIARLLDGNVDSEISINHAKAMLKLV